MGRGHKGTPARPDLLAPDLLWRSYLALELEKIRKVLHRSSERSDQTVFALFREHIDRFFDYIQRNLDKPISPENRRALLRELDRLALYLRFYDSALIHTPPYPLLDHVQRIYDRIQPRSTILLRPRNGYDFETRARRFSLQEYLLLLAKPFSTSAWRPTEFQRELVVLKNIYIVGYPKLMDDIFLFYPLIGHEIGHVLNISTREPEAIVRRLILAHRLESANRGSDAPYSMIEEWAIELFCDLVGLHLFGEPYIYALWFFLLRSPETTETTVPIAGRRDKQPTLNRLQEILQPILLDPALSPSERLADSLERIQPFLYAARDPKSTDSQADDGTSLTHPSPGRRVKFLIDHLPATRSAPTRRKVFREWRRAFFAHHKQYDLDRRSPTDSLSVDLATKIAGALYDAISSTLPTRPSFSQEELDSLLRQLDKRIPPCEYVHTRTAKLEPAAWESAVFAGWIWFLESFAIKAQQDHKGLLPWMNFMYQSLDMIEISASFLAAKELLPNDRD